MKENEVREVEAIKVVAYNAEQGTSKYGPSGQVKRAVPRRGDDQLSHFT